MTNDVTLPGTANPQDETTDTNVSVGPPAEKLYMSFQVRGATEKSIYALFFEQHGKLYSVDNNPDLFMGVFGLPDPAVYERDARGVLPKWYIYKYTPAKNLVMMELKFINEFERGVIIKFVWREGMQDKDVEQFAEKVLARIKEVATVEMITPGPESTQPWEQIPDHEWDREAVMCRWKGYTYAEIAKKVRVSPGRIGNRLSELRKKFGEDIVPYREAAKKALRKSRDTT